MEEKNYTIALLIDTENVSSKYLNALMKELIALGRVTYKRMYGDFTSPTTAGWRNLVNQFSIMPVQQFAYTSGKNVTDSKMIIDAMDILYTGNVDAFCIMSSDSDFTGLAKRLKESNMFVIGAGESKTPASFINACDRFFNMDTLSKGRKQQAEEKETGKKKSKTATSDKKKEKAKEVKEKKEPHETKEAKGTPIVAFAREELTEIAEEERSITPKEEIEEFVESLFENANRTELPLSIIMQKIFQAYPDFNPKDYGASKASKFFNGTQFSQKKGKNDEILICLNED
ncbi:MAG: NYN domain-containing protein [Clostridia bacterium]|nr:NYN domain-containing protein [Clostridia bacterium]